MNFYTIEHQHYCGVDLHAKTMYLCIIDTKGSILLHKNIKTEPDLFLAAVASYRENLVVAVECMFTWYWLSNLCSREGIAFVLGHALYMKAIYGGKAKNDRSVTLISSGPSPRPQFFSCAATTRPSSIAPSSKSATEKTNP